MDVSLISVCDPLATRVPVRTCPFWIGRGEECQLRLNNAMVSRRHAELRLLNGLLRAYDCGSLNGTTVNGALAGRDGITLRDGDLLGVASTVFVVQIVRSRHDSPQLPKEDAGTGSTCIDVITNVPAPR